MMQYRKFGSLDWKVSALGFGCMRLPLLNDDYAQINEPEAMKMVRHAIDLGVNYIDTAYTYHRSNSELFLAKALKNGYRERVRLATKMPCWLVEERADFDRFLNEQLKKLETSHIDFYLLHSLNEKSWHKVRDLGVLEWAESAIQDGRIRHIGFSFHDKYEIFQEIVDAYDKWTFCQIQYNFMDIEEQAGTKGLKYAADKGLAVIVMEPLLGGRLVNPPTPVSKIWESASQQRTPVSWALQWIWSQPEVSVVLSGMSDMRQVEDNLAHAQQSQPGLLTTQDLEMVDQVRKQYRELCMVSCTKCGYCQPCPNGVRIPDIFEMLNNGVMYDQLGEARKQYAQMPLEARADMCIQCRECESVCPQSISICDWLDYSIEVLGKGKALEEVKKPA